MIVWTIRFISLDHIGITSRNIVHSETETRMCALYEGELFIS